MKEQDVYNQLSQWLKYQHPNLIWRWDFAAGQKMSVGMAMRMKKMQCGVAYPDLFIARARGGYMGLYIEVKMDGYDLFQKRNCLAFVSKHVEEQHDCIIRLRSEGYWADFGIGFEGCKKIIEDYLKMERTVAVFPN